MPIRFSAFLALLLFSLFSFPLLAAPLARQDVPEPLRAWVAWVLHGDETVACPPAFNDAKLRVCAWPSDLDLVLEASGGRFRFQVSAFAPDTALVLPGQPDAWPLEVEADGRPVPVLEKEGHPVVRLPAGDHVLTGRFVWRAPPASLALPVNAGVLRASLSGSALPAPDGEGRLWLRQVRGEVSGNDSASLRVFRRIGDDIPLQVATRLELSVAGKPREMVLPLALLPGFLPLGLESTLPARLENDGRLRLQVRPGNWTISVEGRLMAPTKRLALPEGGPSPEEIWSFAAKNDLRLVNATGVPPVDPKQAGVPAPWAELPAFRLRPGEALKLDETRRGDPDPAPDKLSLVRTLWLDFDGGGYTLQDRIGGSLSRSFRLEVAPPVALGRVAVDGEDRFITRLGQGQARGVEVRNGVANLVADSRIEGGLRSLPATGWAADFSSVSEILKLPPGWRLIHASGVDKAQGSWLAQWTLWDFFFVLLLSVAAYRLSGRLVAALLGFGLVLSWHLPDAPQAGWLVLLAFLALGRVARQGRLGQAAHWGQRLALLFLALQLLPFAVGQVRQSIYPSLEMPDHSAPEPGAMGMAGMAGKAELVEDGARMEVLKDSVARRGLSKPAPSMVDMSTVSSRFRLEAVDAGARIQTGPGLPEWSWREHRLSWQGPVERGQEITLWLEPPGVTAFLSFLMLGLLAAALWQIAGRDMLKRSPPVSGLAGLALALCLAGSVQPGEAWATQAQSRAPTRTPVQSGADMPETPPPAILEELRQKLTEPAACQPACAGLARLWVAARGSRIQLRAELHAAQPSMVPLPGAAAQWRPDRVLLDGKLPALRRDEAGILWLSLPEGVHQVTLEGEAGELDGKSAAVQIALPLAPRQVQADLDGWSLSGLDARGQASGALSLTRQAAKVAEAAVGGGKADARDALPPFLRVVRTLHLGQTWTVDTRIERVGPSRAPVTVRVPLLAGEAVTDDVVKVEQEPGASAEGGRDAVLTLGAGENGGFSSSLAQKSTIRLQASKEANQIEVWRLDASPMWHAGFSGIPPVQRLEEQRWLPQWQPWPGESVSLEVQKPLGVEGQTLTLDSANMSVRPGLRAVDVELSLVLRSSQGGNHRVNLPEGAQLLAVFMDGQPQPIRAEGRSVTLPIRPGRQEVKLEWREARGMSTLFRTPAFDAGLPGVNASLQLHLPLDRWLLFLGGPSLGPAVLFWGVALVIGALAFGLGKSRLTPLGGLAWLSLGLGVAQSSLGGTVFLAAFLLAMAARGRYGEKLGRRWFNFGQVMLVLFALATVATLFDAIHTGLLGTPDMLVAGNGSSDHDLRWYADRSAGALPGAWVWSLPIFGWRLLMLAWALWLASGVVNWSRWAWQMFSTGGYWKPAPPRTEAEKAAGGSFLGRSRREEREKGAESEKAEVADGKVE